MSLKKSQPSEKARRVAFFRNGDYFDAGVRLAFRGNKPFATMPHLLDYLSQKSHMPAKKLYAVSTGKPIKSLDQLEDGGTYVIVADLKYVPLPYGSVPRLQTSHVQDALPTRIEDLQLFRPTQGVAFKAKKTKPEDSLADKAPSTSRREGRLITVAARDGTTKATLLFNGRNPPPFEIVLRDFGNVLGLEKVRSMTTASGRQVRSISQLKNELPNVDTFFLEERSSNSHSDNRNTVSTIDETPYKSEKSRRQRHISSNQRLPKAEWIYGYNGSNLLLLETGELVYAVAASVVIYNRTTDSQRHYLRHTEDVCSICVHPSGRMMASGQVSSENQQNSSIHIWMVDTLKLITSLSRLTGNPISVDFSTHDYVLLSVETNGDEDSLSFWDWESDALLARIQMQGERLTGGIFHPKEPELAVTFGVHHLAFWRRQSDGFLGRSDALAPGHSGRTILSWAFVGDSSLAVGDSSGYVTLWALLPEDTFRILREVRAHHSEVRCLLAMREGTLISGGGDQLKAWDTHQRLLPLATTDLPEGEVKSLSLQGHGDIALYVGTSQSILDGSLQSSFRTLVQGIEFQTVDLAIDSKGESFVTVDKSHNIYRWTIGQLIWKTKSLLDLCCAGFHPEGRAVTAGGSNGKLLVLNADGGLVVATISVADVSLKALAYDSDGSTLAIGCEDGNIYICESRNHGYLYSMHIVLKNEWPILQIDWSSDGQHLLSAYRKEDFCEITLWNVSESKILKASLSKNFEWPEHTCTLSHNIHGIWKKVKGVFYLSCHRKGSKLATGAQDGCIRIFSYPYQENERGAYEEWRQSSQPLNLVRFMQKNLLVAASGSAIFIWNLR